MTLDQGDIEEIRGITEELSMREVEEVYLPLSRLLNLHIAAVQSLHRVSSLITGHAGFSCASASSHASRCDRSVRRKERSWRSF